MFKRSYFWILSFFLLIACQMDQQATEHPIITETATNDVMNQTIANTAVRSVLEKEEVIRANAVNTDKLLLLAFEVEQFERFNLKSIQKEIKKQLDEEFEDKQVTASYDPKIMLEIEKLQAKIESKQIDEKKFKKEVKRIVKLHKEKT